jgi:hypothetical protein
MRRHGIRASMASVGLDEELPEQGTGELHSTPKSY